MQKKYLIILVVLVIAGGFQLYLYFSDSVPASRQQIELSTSEFAAEGEFALDAVKSYYHDSRKFSRCWNNYGDIFQNAVKLLKERKLREPDIRRRNIAGPFGKRQRGTGSIHAPERPHHAEVVFIDLVDQELPNREEVVPERLLRIRRIGDDDVFQTLQRLAVAVNAGVERRRDRGVRRIGDRFKRLHQTGVLHFLER